MGKPIPYDYRKLIIKKRKSGETYSRISEQIGYSVSGIRKIWITYQEQGSSSLLTKYENCGRPKLYDAALLEEVDKCRGGKQGGSFVYSKYKLDHPNENCPSIRTIQRHWATQKTNRPKGRPCTVEKKVGQ